MSQSRKVNDDVKIRIPIERLKELSRALELSHVILLAHHPASGEDHIVTYGKSLKDCSQAAEFGNALRHAMGWPESLHVQPARVKKLQARVKELDDKEDTISRMGEVIGEIWKALDTAMLVIDECYQIGNDEISDIKDDHVGSLNSAKDTHRTYDPDPCTDK